MRQHLILMMLVPLLQSAFPRCAAAHGTAYQVIEGAPAVTVECYYSTQEPMSYAEAVLFSPADENVEYQNGRTDRRGRFAFLPDTAGTWRLEVNDGLGHMVQARIEVAKTGGRGQEAGPGPGLPDAGKPGGASPLMRAATGLSVILNLALALMVWRMRRRRSRDLSVSA